MDVHVIRIIEVQRQLTAIRLNHWLNEEVFAWQWWFLLAFMIISYVVLWKLLDRKRVYEILCFGLLIAITATILDVLGNELTLWVYPNKLVPIIPRLIELDLASIPVAYMLIYQWFPQWKRFIWALILFSAFGSFVMEPFFVWAQMYQPLTWKHIYSFPIYILLGIVYKWVIEKIRPPGIS